MENIPFNAGPINNEVDFCRVFDSDTKRKIEKIFVDNRISYYCQYEDKGFFHSLLKPRQDAACVFRIHDAEVARAKELLRKTLGESKKKKKEKEDKKNEQG